MEKALASPANSLPTAAIEDLSGGLKYYCVYLHHVEIGKQLIAGLDENIP
jgi:hypothetical protein